MGNGTTHFRRIRAAALAAVAVMGVLLVEVVGADPASAAAAANLDQCGNGPAGAPVPCTGTNWQNGNLNAGNSHYRENDSVPFRVVLTDLVAGPVHTLDIQYDNTSGGKHAYDYLTSFNRTEGTADPCSNSGVSPCIPGTPGNIPVDPNLANAVPPVSQIPGVISIWNGAITGVSYLVLPPGPEGTANQTTVRISFTVNNNDCDAGGCDAVIAWGGHIASALDWGFGDSANAVNGSPYHMRLIDLDGGGGNQDKSLSAASVLPPPVIATQVSNATPGVGGNVTDTATLTGNENQGLVVTGTITFFICGPAGAPPNCATGGVQQGAPVPIVNNSATSTAFTALLAGNYCFRAVYTPDAASQYSPGSHTNTTTECFNAQSPGLVLTKAPDAATVSAGTPIGYTLTINNTGAVIATGVTLTDTLPNNTGLIWTEAPNIAACAISAANPQVLTCAFGDIAPGGSVSVHITSPTTGATCGTVSNSASAASTNGGQASAGPSDITVNCPLLQVTKVADAGSVPAGTPIGFTITVTNIGTGDATNVVLSDPLPTNAGLSWSINPPVAGCGIGGNPLTLTCNFGTLTSGSFGQVHITSPTTIATCGGTVFNTATATASNAAPGPPASSGPVGIVVTCPATCQPPFTPVQVISGTVNTPVVITQDTVIQNATINASVDVRPGVKVFINNSTINGAVNSVNAAEFYMFGTTAQNVKVNGTTGPVVIGNTPGGTGTFGTCTGNNLKSLDVVNNTGGVSVVNNSVTGAVNVSYNNSPQGPTLIKSNTIGGGLACYSNTPAPTNGGGPNSVSGPRAGQCRAPFV